MSAINNFRVIVNGRDGLVSVQRDLTINDAELASQKRRNAMLTLMSDIETIDSVKVYDLSVTAEAAIATFQPVEFDKLSGQWSVTYAVDHQPKRPVDVKRATTFKYDKPLKEGGKPVEIDERVDLEQQVYETLNAFRGESNEKAKLSGSRETKADLTAKVTAGVIALRAQCDAAKVAYLETDGISELLEKLFTPKTKK